MYALLRYLPKNYLSAFVGACASLPVPRVLRRLVLGTFVRLSGASLAEASKPLQQYRSIADFFTRDLKAGLRVIDEQALICSPVDGKLLYADGVNGERLPQVKGRSYSLAQFLGSAEDAAVFAGGAFFHFYLAPPDYHHVHAPFEGTLQRIRHIPGFLWPVNSWALDNIPDLFSRNERVVLFFTTPLGRAAVVLIGATNVGKITLTVSGLSTNRPWRSQRVTEEDGGARNVRRGERLGTFHLGSSVVVLVEKVPPGDSGALPRSVKFGERVR